MTTGSSPKPASATAATPRHQRGYVSSYGEGRLCAGPDCTTTLSRYNSSDLCYPHAEEARLRRNRPGG